jgi:hypothetical protein
MRKFLLFFFLLTSICLQGYAAKSQKTMKVSASTSDTVTVYNLSTLKSAIEAAPLNRLILLRASTDTLSLYDLGSSGITFPTNQCNLTLKAANDTTPIVRGTFKSASGTWMILNSLTIDGITIDGNDGSAQAFIVSNRDTVLSLYTIKNCTFKNQKTNQFWYSNGTPAFIKEVVVESNIFSNFGGSTAKGSTGGTFVQLQNKAASYNDLFTFRNNTFTNWHGNQFFNSARQTTTDTTGIVLTFDNNTFYKFGGNATSARNFVEWGNTPKYYKVKGSSTGADTTIVRDIPFTLNIRNNFFYGNQTDTVGKIKNVKLFTPSTTNQGITLNFQKNVYDPTEVGFAIINSTCTWADSTSNTISGLGITTDIFVNDSLASSQGDLTMYKNTALFTAGLDGTCVGDPRWYTNESTPPSEITSVETTTKLNAYSNNNTLYIYGTEKPVILYNTVGQRLGIYTAGDAENGISIRTTGIVIVHSNGETIRVMIK